MSDQVPQQNNENSEPTSAVLSNVTGHRLRRLHSLFSTRLGHWFRNVGLNITPVQGGVLLLIDENPGLTQVALARLLCVEAPTVYQSLTPLVDAGYVDRRRSSGDGRAIALHLTETGRTAMESVSLGSLDNQAILLSQMSVEDQLQLGDLLDKALTSAENVVNAEAEDLRAQTLENARKE